MPHWTERYVGRPFVEGSFDCGELARTVQREVFGREVPLPSERWYAGKEGAERLRAMAAQVEGTIASLAQRVPEPREGDLVMMYSGSRVMHAGIYCVLVAEPWVLHAAERMGQVVLTRVRELADKGYKLEGYWRWT